MKVTNIRRKLAAALVAAGMLTPGALHAADLNTDLVINGDFELVDTGTLAPAYNSPQILNWMGTAAFAYTHEPGITGGSDFAEPADNSINPPSAGNWYFTANNSGAPDIGAAGLFFQDISVASGNTGAAIANDQGHFVLSAYISSYVNDTDVGHVHVDFLNSGSTSIGSLLVSDSDSGPNNVWSLNSGVGILPVGTETVRLSLYGTRTEGGPGPDGYIDNVRFLISDQPILPALSLTVDRVTGGMTLANQTGEAVNLASYVITSAFEGLVPANWLSIAENYDAGSSGVNQVDGANDWSELTNSSAHGDLSEADLDSGTGTLLAQGKTVNLGTNNTWIRTPTEDLVFRYVSDGQIVQGVVLFTGHNDEPFDTGDINTDGSINVTDWGILRGNQHKALSSDSLAEAYRMGDMTGDGLNNYADFNAFKIAYDNANGVGSFNAMVSAVPEPSTVVLLMSAGLFALPLARRRLIES